MKEAFSFIILFIFGCAGSLLLCSGFLYLQQAGATFCCSAWASHYCGAWALGTWASVFAAFRLQGEDSVIVAN